MSAPHLTYYHWQGTCPSQVFVPCGSEWQWGDPVSIAVVGQSPSTARPYARRYEVFGSKSWNLVRQLVERWTSTGHTVLLTNAIQEPLAPKARIPKRVLDAASVDLGRRLELFAPKYVVAVGGHAARLVLGEQFHSLNEDHGTVFTSKTGSLVMPTFHFSTSYSDLAMRRNITRDLERFEAALVPSSFLVPPSYEVYEQALPDSVMAALRRAPYVVLDIESTGLDPRKDTLTALGLRFDSINRIVTQPDPSFVARLARLLFQSKTPLVGHNLYFDLQFLAVQSTRTWDQVLVAGDTMLMALVLGEPTLSLKHLTSVHTDLNGSHSFGGPEDPAYLSMDLLATQALYDLFEPQVRDRAVMPLLHEMVPYLVEARVGGVAINRDELAAIGEVLTAQLAELELKLRSIAGREELNPSSDLQVSEWLKNQGAKTGLLTPSGRMSVSSDALTKGLSEQQWSDDVRSFVLELIEYRALRKLASGFVDNYTRLMDEDGFLHPRLLLHGARTGRLSSSDPNIQQVPRGGPVKSLFISRWKGGLYGLIDLSQAELRVAALLSGDEELLSSLLQADPHRYNAARLYGKPAEEVTAVERKKSKAITFGVLYGGSPEGLASRTTFHVEEVREAQALFNQAFPVLMQWLKKVETEGMATLSVTTLLGRTRELQSVLSVEGERGARRKCANTHIQSLASDINLLIARTIVRALRSQRLQSRLLFLVHDSIVLDIHPDEVDSVSHLVQEAYRTFAEGTPLADLPLWGRLPIIGELIVGSSWAAVESTNELYNPVATFPCSSAAVEAA